MRTALTLFAVAGMTMAAKTVVHHGEDGHNHTKVVVPAIKPVPKGPTPNDKPVVHWGEQSYAQTAKKGAALGLFKLSTHSGEESRLSAIKKRLGQKLRNARKNLHRHGEEAVKKGKKLRNRLHRGEDHKHTRKTAKLALFKLPTFSGEEFHALRQRLGKRLAGLKSRLHHFGEESAKTGRRWGQKAVTGMRKLHRHGEESHVKKTAKLALFKLPTFSGEEFGALRQKLGQRLAGLKTRIHSGEQSATHTTIHQKATILKKKVVHAGEELVKKTVSAAKTVANGVTTVTKKAVTAVKNLVNHGEEKQVKKATLALLKKSATVNGEETVKKTRKNKKNKKNAKKVHSGETSRKHKNPLSRRNKRHARKHAGEETVKKAKKTAALGLYELSSLLNLNDA